MKCEWKRRLDVSKVDKFPDGYSTAEQKQLRNSSEPKIIAGWESSQGMREAFGFGFFSWGTCSQPGLDPEPQVGWIPAPVRAVSATFLCREENVQMSMTYGRCKFGTTAAGSYLERKNFPITVYLKNSKGPLQFSITSYGITKTGILPYPSSVLKPHLLWFFLFQMGGKAEFWARIGCYTPKFLYSFFGEKFRAVTAVSM